MPLTTWSKLASSVSDSANVSIMFVVDILLKHVVLISFAIKCKIRSAK